MLRGGINLEAIGEFKKYDRINSNESFVETIVDYFDDWYYCDYWWYY